MLILRKIALVNVVLIFFYISGCSRDNYATYHKSQDIDFSFVKKVAVMPLENLTDEKSAGDIVRQLTISELLASGLVDVEVPGEVFSAVNDLGIKNLTSLTNQQIIAIGKYLKVQAVIMGSVQEYGHVRFGSISAPEVTISLFMADTGTGDIIWSVTKTRGGASFMTRHFGAKSDTMSEAVLIVVREAIDTLAEY
jgi:PBP1b-binding outer membrane lipoprotein LpoB